MTVMEGPVSVVEIAQLAAEARRLSADRDLVSVEERLAYLDRKVEVFERIAVHEVVSVDRRTAEEALVFAQVQRDELRAMAGRGR